jgi:hypothetical protein
MKWKKICLSVNAVRTGTSTVLTEFGELREIARQDLQGVDLVLYHQKSDRTFQVLVFPPAAWKPYNDFLEKFDAVEIDEPHPSELVAVWGKP